MYIYIYIYMYVPDKLMKMIEPSHDARTGLRPIG